MGPGFHRNEVFAVNDQFSYGRKGNGHGRGNAKNVPGDRFTSYEHNGNDILDNAEGDAENEEFEEEFKAPGKHRLAVYQIRREGGSGQF